MSPLMGLEVPPGPFDWTVAWQLLALSLLYSAVAYLIYFRLMTEIGPTRGLNSYIHKSDCRDNSGMDLLG